MNRLVIGVVLAVSAGLLACGSDSTGSSTSSGGSSSSSGGSTSSSGSSSGGAAAEPPKLKAVVKMMGYLHVQWTNPSVACESVEGERMAQMSDGTMMEEYKVVFTVPGTVDNKMDPSATEDMKYTYRIRCKGTSKYSETMSANPKQ